MSLFQKKEPEPAYVLNKPLTCGICGHARFWQREAQLHTGIATFFNLEWAEKSATCIVCENCGYIYWFLPPEEH